MCSISLDQFAAEFSFQISDFYSKTAATTAKTLLPSQFELSK